MRRPEFLRRISLAPLVPLVMGLAQSPPVDPVTVVLSDMIEYWSGGIRPTDAYIKITTPTGDSRKHVVFAKHPNGEWHSKVVLTSGLMMSMRVGHRAELAYGLGKRTKEIARDWAHLEWGPDWRLHVPHLGYYAKEV